MVYAFIIQKQHPFIQSLLHPMNLYVFHLLQLQGFGQFFILSIQLVVQYFHW